MIYRLLVVFFLANFLVVQALEAAFRCSRAHIHGRVTPIATIAVSPNRQIGNQVFQAYLRFLEVSRGRMANAGATAEEYIRANILEKEKLREALLQIADSIPNDPIGIAINRNISHFATREKERLRYESFIEMNRHTPIRDLAGLKEFEAIFSMLTATVHGTVGQLLVASLVQPTAMNQKVTSLTNSRQILLDHGFSRTNTLREIDMTETLPDGKIVWGEVKIGGGRLRLDSRMFISVLRQAESVQKVHEVLRSLGIDVHHRIYLAFREVDPNVIRALVRAGAEVVVIDIFEEFDR